MKLFITGVSRGIGKATVKALLDQGHFVWGVSRTVPADLVEARTRGTFRHSVADVGDSASCARVAEELQEEGFIPDIVMLNAAIEYEEASDDVSWAKMRSVFRANVEGACFWVAHWMNQAPRPVMQFVGISSLVAYWPDIACPAYCASKSALSMVFRAWRLRYAGESSRFKLVYLGPVHTSINPRFMASIKPGGLAVLPEDVADYVVNHVVPGSRFSYYYPWSTALLCRFGAWVPDRLFEWMTRPLRR